jgi:hypothetical protein
VRRALALLLIIATGAVVATGGCASHPTAVREHDWQHYEPDGGWQAKGPARPEYDPDPAKAVLGQPSLQPAGLGGTSVH